jgi:hypothetical protein
VLASSRPAQEPSISPSAWLRPSTMRPSERSRRSSGERVCGGVVAA